MGIQKGEFDKTKTKIFGKSLAERRWQKKFCHHRSANKKIFLLKMLIQALIIPMMK
jgi:hypothetical protein